MKQDNTILVGVFTLQVVMMVLLAILTFKAYLFIEDLRPVVEKVKTLDFQYLEELSNLAEQTKRIITPIQDALTRLDNENTIDKLSNYLENNTRC